MPAQRRFGMDHAHYTWSPLIKRGVLRWPEQARVAFCVIVNLEHMEWYPPPGSYQVPTLAGGLGPRSFPDYPRLTHREYGHRVGVFRTIAILKAHGITPTVAMDTLTAEHYPYLVRYCLQQGCEIIGHGISVSQMITSQMTEQEERDYIRQSIDTLTRATGKPPVGWFGPEYGESPRTPQLLAQAGIRYVCDWANDEQPYPLTTRQGDCFALPILLELDDIHALWDRQVPIDRYAALLQESFEGLYQDGAHTGRLLVLNLHPWLIGQPFRISYLHDALGCMMRRQGVWAATGAAIIDWYQQHPPA
jgi:peptidoglycan/xylan/chitin deacetylase (PgdA/CDA1 family)